ncbi:MAG: hypothetical protein J1E63_08080 [Muribaculaceae bacterium]|nr:hypothetical protein [Muribaculaceae bacterium]
MKKISLTSSQFLSILLLAVSTIGFLVWNLNLGYQADDWWYKHYCPNESEVRTDSVWRDFYTISQPEITTFDQALKSIQHHNTYWNNSRLGNALMFISVLFPKWVTDIFHAAMVLLMMWSLARLSSGRRWINHPLRLAAITLFVWVGWPWWDLKGSSDFFFNYVWSAASVLYFCVLFENTTSRSSWRYIAWTSFVGFIASMIHEGVTLPFLIGIVGYIVLPYLIGNRYPQLKRPCLGQIIGASTMVIGVLIITVFSPAFMSRFNDYDYSTIGWIYFVMCYVIKLYFIYAGFIIALWLGLKRGWKWFKNAIARNILMILATTGGIVLYLYTGLGWTRAAWAIYMASTVLLVRGVGSLDLFNRRPRLSLTLATVGTILSIGFFINLCTVQHKRTDEINRLRVEIAADPKIGIYYADVSYAPDPWWLWGMSLRAISSYKYIDEIWRMQYNHVPNDGYLVLPTKYRGVPLDSLPIAPGTARLKGVYPFYFEELSESLDSASLPHFRNYFVTFRFPEETSPFVKYSPISVGRLVWHPMGKYNDVSTGYRFNILPVTVTPELRASGLVKHDTKMIIVYTFNLTAQSLNGMLPVSIDL